MRHAVCRREVGGPSALTLLPSRGYRGDLGDRRMSVVENGQRLRRVLSGPGLGPLDTQPWREATSEAQLTLSIQQLSYGSQCL